MREALIGHGRPAIFNTDRGVQFTSLAFTGGTGLLIRKGVAISMNGRGRALDNIFVERLGRNVKHEDVYLNGYATIGDLTVGLTRYFTFDNEERPHQSLNYQTPDVVYTSGTGGAMIVDKYGGVVVKTATQATPVASASSAGEHGASPQTPPCWEPAAITATVMGVEN